jgi:hypothetical protein
MPSFNLIENKLDAPPNNKNRYQYRIAKYDDDDEYRTLEGGRKKKRCLLSTNTINVSRKNRDRQTQCLLGHW